MKPMDTRLSSATFVGRHDEAATLRESAQAAARRQPSLVFVAGDAGVGKTRLIRDLEQHVGSHAGLILRGECLALSGDFPYAPIVAALRDAGAGALAAALARLSPESRGEIGRLMPEIAAELERRTAQLNQGRLFELLLALLRHLADEATVLFVVEDAHWADASTRDFLSFLARNLSSERVLVVVTYRPDELSLEHPLRLLLGELRRRPTVASLSLAPLPVAAIQQLVEDILGTQASLALVAEIFERSQGNPFFAEELLAARTGAGGDRLPESLRDALLVRCHALAPDALELLRTLAVLGRPARHEQLGALAEIDEPRLSAALRSAIEGHVLTYRAEDDRFEFRHALVREALTGDLLPGERTVLHRAIARHLASSEGSSAAELAFHCDLAGDAIAAIEASIQAGLEAARVYASAESRLHLERALRLWSVAQPPSDSMPLDRVDLLRHAAEAARLMGDWDGAVERCAEAVSLVDASAQPLRAALLHERAGEYQLWDDEAALDSYSTALALLPADCGRERARILGAKALALHFLQRWEQARDCGLEALDEARAAGARAEEGYAANVLGIALAFLGEHDRGEAHVRDAKRIAEEGGSAEEVGRTYAHLAEILRIHGDVAGAVAVMIEGQQVAARMGMANWFGSAMSVGAAEDLLRLGRWDDTQERLLDAARLDLSTLAQLLHGSVQGRLWVGRGRFDEAAVALARARGACDERTPVGYVVGPFAGLAELALWRRRPLEARRAIAEAFALIAGRDEPLYVPVLFWLGVRAEVDLALAAGQDGAAELDAAAQLCARLEALVARYSASDEPADAAAYLLLARAELSRGAEQPPPAWVAAATALHRIQHPPLHAYAGWREVEAILVGGHPRATATATLRGARTIASGLGARPLLDEIDALARAARLDLVARSEPEPAGTDGAATARAVTVAKLGLTARELDVLALIAEGCTNREIAGRLFISEKTASVHVSHILSKLNVENRVRAAATARRLGLFDTTRVTD